MNRRPIKRMADMKKQVRIIVLLMILTCTCYANAFGGTLDIVKKRGFVKVGLLCERAGFLSMDQKGQLSGMDIDIAKAIAAAVLGNHRKVKFTSLTSVQLFPVMASGAVDVLLRVRVGTLSAPQRLKFLTTQPYFFDGQGFMVHEKSGINSILGLKNKRFCILLNSAAGENAYRYLISKGVHTKKITIANKGRLSRSFMVGQCDCMTDDVTSLARMRLQSGSLNKFVILPGTITKKEYAPMVRRDSDTWKEVVHYAVMALIKAEEFGITSKNVYQKLSDPHLGVKRFLGAKDGYGRKLGLSNRFAYNIIKSVGNYGEIYDRHFGKNSRLKLDRGSNALSINRGKMFSRGFDDDTPYNPDLPGTEARGPVFGTPPGPGNGKSAKLYVNKLAIVIGIADYQDLQPADQTINKNITDLKYSENDAKDFISFLSNDNRSGGNWKIKPLIGKNATTENVKNSLADVLGNAKKDDLVYIFFAGHARRSPSDASEIYLLTYDFKYDNSYSGVWYEWLKKKIIRSKARNIIAFIDACRSGTVGFGSRGGDAPDHDLLGEIAGLKGFKAIFTSGTGSEPAYEDDKLKNGIFTHFLLRGMKGEAKNRDNDIFVDLGELEDFVASEVRKYTQKDKTIGQQKPKLWSSDGLIPEEFPVALRK